MNQYESEKIAFIKAGWHADIVDQSYEGFIAGIAGKIPAKQVDVFEVPGSLEIPLQCQLLAKSNRYQVIVAAGLIVDGGIYRHEFVAQTVLDGLMRVQLDFNTPILSVVLTPHHFQESEQHQEFFYQHFKLKGAEAAKACLSVIENRKSLGMVA